MVNFTRTSGTSFRTQYLLTSLFDNRERQKILRLYGWIALHRRRVALMLFALAFATQMLK